MSGKVSGTETEKQMKPILCCWRAYSLDEKTDAEASAFNINDKCNFLLWVPGNTQEDPSGQLWSAGETSW
jgi:hypothetical protein